MDLNPELLSAIDRLCVGLVVQCMFQCRVHNLNPRGYLEYCEVSGLRQLMLVCTTKKITVSRPVYEGVLSDPARRKRLVPPPPLV